MKEYHKIPSVYKRDEKTHKFIPGAWSTPEFEYLAGTEWTWTEKVDGTNVRVGWDGEQIRIGGRTDSAQMATFLHDRLTVMFSATHMRDIFPADDTPPDQRTDIVLYGEGYGAKIQKGGGNYKPDGVDFVLFDVRIGPWWLKREDVEDVSTKLGINVVPIVGRGTLAEAEGYVRGAPKSTWGDFTAEGIVCRPAVELQDRAGRRVITKMKVRDF